TFAHPVQAPPALELDWTRTDWATISPLLKALTLPQPPALPTRQSFEAWFDRGLDSLTSILRVNTPHKRPSARSKPWWSSLLPPLPLLFPALQPYAPLELPPTAPLRNHYRPQEMFPVLRARPGLNSLLSLEGSPPHRPSPPHGPPQPSPEVRLSPSIAQESQWGGARQARQTLL